MPNGAAEISKLVPRDQVVGVIRDLQKAHVNLDALAAAETDIFLKSIRRAQSYTYRRVAEILAESQLNPKWDYARKLRWYTENWASIEQALSDSGYTAAAGRYIAGYDQLAGMAERTLAAGLPRVSSEFTRLPKSWINFVKRRDYAWFNFLGQEAIRKLDETVMWNVLAGRSPAGLLQELKGTITGSYPWGNKRGLYEWHAGTYARTAHHRAAATWKAEKAKELQLDWRVYVGPIDSKTREVCLEWVGNAYTVQEIEQLDNGQTGNVLVDRGGWSCRHDWDPIDKELAETIRADAGTAEAVRTVISQSPLTHTLPKPAPPRHVFNPAPVEDWAPAKSLAEAEAWALSHDLADVANFTGLDLRVANDVNRVLSTLLREFPEARQRIQFIGARQQHRAWAKKNVFEQSMRRWDRSDRLALREQGLSEKEIAKRRRQFARYERRSIDEHIDGYYHLEWKTSVAYYEPMDNARGLVWSESYWSPNLFDRTVMKRREEMEAARRHYQQTGVGGYRPPGSYTIEHNVAHEFGHVLDYTKGLRHDLDFTEMRFWTFEQTRDRLCTYAAEYYSEVFSCLFEEFWANGATAAGMRHHSRRYLKAMFAKFGVRLTE
jgi:hypothetical protein